MRKKLEREILEIIAKLNTAELICFQALALVHAQGKYQFAPKNSRSELKQAIKLFRIAQHCPDCSAEHYEVYEQCVQYIRREWLHRAADCAP